MTKFWIKHYIGTLNEPKIALLPDHLWRRLVELSLVAGKQGEDGGLPSVEGIAWLLRQSEGEILEDLHALAVAGFVLESEPGKWFVTDFKEQQTSNSYERVKRYRERYGNVACNADVTAGPSTSTSSSISNSDSISDSISNSDFESDSEGIGAHTQKAPKGRGQAGAGGEGRHSQKPGEGGEYELHSLPTTPAEAMVHPDVRVYTEATGRIPGLAQYRTVIDSVRFLRAREKLGDQALAAYLMPYWLAWSSRKRLDGRPYDPGNITWLAEWAVNGSIPLQGTLPLQGTFPPAGGQKAVDSARPAALSVEETRRMLAEKDELLKKAVPPPLDMRARIQGLKRQAEVNQHADIETMGQEGTPDREASPPAR